MSGYAWNMLNNVKLKMACTDTDSTTKILN